MKLNYLEKPGQNWFRALPKTKEHPRHYETIVDLEITLSNGFILKTKAGDIWDGASVPSWLHWLFKPIDEGALGDYIHDKLWERKKEQLEKFNYNFYKARKFADAERMNYRLDHAPKRKYFNTISNLIIRLIGGLYYSRQIKIPN